MAATKSNAVHITKAVNDLKDEDESRQRSMTFHGILDSVLSKYMVDKWPKQVYHTLFLRRCMKG